MFVQWAKMSICAEEPIQSQLLFNDRTPDYLQRCSEIYAFNNIIQAYFFKTVLVIEAAAC